MNKDNADNLKAVRQPGVMAVTPYRKNICFESLAQAPSRQRISRLQVIWKRGIAILFQQQTCAGKIFGFPLIAETL
jgi:hypothetical protein